MITLMAKAAENFCIHQIRQPHTLSDKKIETRTLIAYIDIAKEDGANYRIYTAYNEAMIQMIAELFLGEDESDEETLQDMALETANMIIGSAKVLAAEESDLNFTISTPHFEKDGNFDLSSDAFKTITIDDKAIMIAIKEQ
ncbi:MAG: chemotaxis protein CheX [Campylobacterota bacterium]|nr:chemotaxis protein CheX [Campylobacterota bacterium]